MIASAQGVFLEAAPPGGFNVVASLLAARAASSAAGNRRGLFARMDEILGEVPDEGSILSVTSADAVVASALAVGGGRISLARLRLRNWKSFEAADIALPDGDAERPLVVIGGPNGFGKSSILEAFSLGLFGRRALTEMGQFVTGTVGRGGARRSYRSILRRSLHRSSRAADDGSCSVTLDFATGSGPVQVERRWYFDEGGELIEDEEEVLVRVGEERMLLRPPPGVAAGDWRQAEVERLIMPAALAPFFVFDGEQIERRADRHLADQVRSALNRLLGLDDLAGLAADLGDYARDRERGFAEAEIAAINLLREEVGRGLDVATSLTAALADTEFDLAELRIARDRALTTLSAIQPAPHSDLQGGLEAEHRLAAERRQLDRDLAAAICEDGPLLLAGPTLLAAARSTLLPATDAENGISLEPEEVEALWARFVAVDPPLDESSSKDLRIRFEAACALRPNGASKNPSGAELGRSERRSVVARLETAEDAGRSRLSSVLIALDANGAALRALGQAARDADERASALDDARGELARVADAVRRAEEARTVAIGRLAAVRHDLEPRSGELARHEAGLRAAEPRLRAASTARRIAAALDANAVELATAEHARFAAAVTSRFREMAHKEQIAEIAIGGDGAVTLKDAQGRDVSDYPLSAGESQLFAMALVAAVGDLAGDRLPLIVDTPLGRLDSDHRRNVMGMLSRRAGQTIMLTQPEEISRAHLAELAPVLALSAELRHDVDAATGVGVSRIAAVTLGAGS